MIIVTMSSIHADTHAVGAITVNHQDFPVTFNSRSGTFTADVNGRSVGAQFWDELRIRVTTEERRSRVKVAVEFVDPDTGRTGTATGLHATRRTPLIRWADGGTSQEDVRSPLRPDTDVAELTKLVTASRDADRALRTFRGEHRLGGYHSLAATVEEAIKETLAEQDRAEAEGG